MPDSMAEKEQQDRDRIIRDIVNVFRGVLAIHADTLESMLRRAEKVSGPTTRDFIRDVLREFGLPAGGEAGGDPAVRFVPITINDRKYFVLPGHESEFVGIVLDAERKRKDPAASHTPPGVIRVEHYDEADDPGAGASGPDQSERHRVPRSRTLSTLAILDRIAATATTMTPRYDPDSQRHLDEARAGGMYGD